MAPRARWHDMPPDNWEQRHSNSDHSGGSSGSGPVEDESDNIVGASDAPDAGGVARTLLEHALRILRDRPEGSVEFPGKSGHQGYAARAASGEGVPGGRHGQAL